MIDINSPSVAADGASRVMVGDMRLAERLEMGVRVGNRPLVRQSDAPSDLIVPGADAGVLGEFVEICRHCSEPAVPWVVRTLIGGHGNGAL